MNKELEALDRILTDLENLDFDHNRTKDFNLIAKSLREYTQIKNAEPSEALKILEEVEYAPSFMGGNDRYRTYLGSDKLYMEDINIIRQCILKTQEQEKVLKPVFEKRIDLESFYITFIENDYDYNYYEENYGTYGKYKLTHEEFDSLKEFYLEER